MAETAVEREATIFNIQKYNMYDGPGVRTLIFFQGCPLRSVKEKIQNLIHDENLEFQMTFQHRRLLEFLEHLTAGREMENIIRQSMGTFTGHVFSSGSGGSGGREKSLEVQAASSFSAYA